MLYLKHHLPINLVRMLTVAFVAGGLFLAGCENAQDEAEETAENIQEEAEDFAEDVQDATEQAADELEEATDQY